MKFTKSHTSQHYNEHPHKYNLYGLSSMLADYAWKTTEKDLKYSFISYCLYHVKNINFRNINIFVIIVILFYLIFTWSCKPGNKNIDIITVEINESYSEKKIQLESFSNIEYVVMHDSTDFLFKGLPQCITNNTILIHDVVSGDFLFFSRRGFPISRFNIKGSGPNQFMSFSSLIYDENKDELFVFSGHKVLVYSSSGDYIRDFSLLEGTWITEVQEFDNNSFIVYDESESYDSDFFLISKENGEIIDFILLPRNEKPQLYIMEMAGNNMNIVMGKTFNIVNHQDGFLLTSYSLDSVYLYDRNRDLNPFLVRKPRIQEMQPLVYLNSLVESSEYHFLQTIKVEKQDNRLPSKSILRDKKNNNIYSQRIILNEFEGKQIEITPDCISKTRNSRIGFFELDLDELQVANKDGRLNGKLKKITDSLNNNDNNIYMFVHFN